MTALLEVRDLRVHFPITGGIWRRRVGSVRAVDGVSFDVREGECLGIVGESGCGKTTLGRTIVRLYRPDGGTIRFRGVAIESLDETALRPLRRELQMIFQDPFASLNPRMSVAATLMEPLRIQRAWPAERCMEEVRQVAALVGLKADDLTRYPHEFSGGQRQRIGIARALVLHPSLVVADEPVSALDVSIQAQVLNLMVDLQRRLALTYLFISHDLAVVKYVADRIGVMYLGRLVELTPAASLYERPLHPYTRALLGAVPSFRSRRARVRAGEPASEPPNPMRPPGGCAYHPRCPHARDVCRAEAPALRPAAGAPPAAPHLAACHFAGEI